MGKQVGRVDRQDIQFCLCRGAHCPLITVPWSLMEGFSSFWCSTAGIPVKIIVYSCVESNFIKQTIIISVQFPTKTIGQILPMVPFIFLIPFATTMLWIPDKCTISGEGVSDKEVKSSLGDYDTQSDLGRNACYPQVPSNADIPIMFTCYNLINYSL